MVEWSKVCDYRFAGQKRGGEKERREGADSRGKQAPGEWMSLELRFAARGKVAAKEGEVVLLDSAVFCRESSDRWTRSVLPVERGEVGLLSSYFTV